MLSSVTINCQVTMIVMISGSQISILRIAISVSIVTSLKDCLFNCQIVSVDKIVNKFIKNCQNCPKLLKKIVNFSKLSKGVKSCHNYQKTVKIVNKIVKIVKLSKLSKLSKIVKLLVRSCFLISVIKCLKDHWSLGSHAL